MELRYCENCGEVVRLESAEPLTLSERFVCDSCTAKSGAGAADKPAGAGENMAFDQYLKGEQLNLFSQKTINLRKEEYEQKVRAQEQEQEPKSKRLRLVRNEAEEAQAPGSAVAGIIPGTVAGSAAPSKEARKILFRCLHCRSPLSIRPVDRDSKLTCPQCSNLIYVTASGRLLKSTPSTVVKPAGVGLLSVCPTPDPVAPAGAGGSRRIATGGAAQPARTAPSGPGAGGATPAVKQVSPRQVGLGPAGPPARPTSTRRIVPAGPAQPARPQSSRRLTLRPSAEAGAAASAPRAAPAAVKAVGSSRNLASMRPGDSARIRKSSAFEEHRARTDPEKTVFITDEPTTSLSLMAAEPMLGPGSAAAAGRRRGPRGENTDLAALARGAAHGSPGAGAGSFGPRAGTGSPPQLTRFLLLLVVLAAPILAAGAPLLARFEAKPGTVVEGPASEALHQLGECASGGIQRLLELVGASE